MVGASLDVDRYAFDVIDRLEGKTEPGQVMTELVSVMRHFGFSSLIVTGVPLPHQNLEALVLAHHWPEGWWDRYNNRGYAQIDPAMRKVMSSVMPFVWSESRTPTISREQALILDEAGDFGLADGYCVPIHSGGGLDACVSFGADRVALSRREQRSLHLISLYGYEAIRRARLPGDGGGSFGLTPQQIECIRWAAEGKSNWEIGQILAISENTVKNHLAGALERTGSTSRAHLVARCLRRKIIP
ncbi:MAG: helix-turn-helix transcriptional regulator [Phreatobacter sp.]|jgi:LuxR family quorum sensing-dependent transcriptional regulator|uniref:helix-turn-helix transcriptional regulator n=1 Tax=Phreatobacter sp. TaxID=1966341 RepID=UPI004036FBA5